ncbi:MAG: GNAT family N-acetyltransferase [Candidatus Thorarchaeota archaeon]|nr:GNAT family N-acetyltransferase [Candidatus Thorarchaeota archaeon]
MTYETRPILMKDVRNVVRIENEYFKHPWNPSFFMFLAENQGHVLDYDGDTTMLVVAVDGIIVAYVVWKYNLLEKKGHLLNLAVDQGHRRKGIARSLMNQVFLSLIDAKAALCILEVRESNASAQSFYREMGMTPIKRNIHYYGDEDAIIYQKVF